MRFRQSIDVLELAVGLPMTFDGQQFPLDQQPHPGKDFVLSEEVVSEYQEIVDGWSTAVQAVHRAAF